MRLTDLRLLQLRLAAEEIVLLGGSVITLRIKEIPRCRVWSWLRVSQDGRMQGLSTLNGWMDTMQMFGRRLEAWDSQRLLATLRVARESCNLYSLIQ